jgi:hypothetical protein
MIHGAHIIVYTLLTAVIVGNGCAPQAQCNSLHTPETIVTVSDLATGQPICGATVTVWRLWDDAAVGTSTFGGGPEDTSCTGQYGGFLDNTAVWTIHVSKAGYETKMATVSGPAAIDCNKGGNDSPQQVSVALTPAH